MQVSTITVPPREGKSASWLQLTASSNPIVQILAIGFLPRKFL